MNLPQLYGPYDFLVWDMLMVMLAFLAGLCIGRYLRCKEAFGKGYNAGYNDCYGEAQGYITRQAD